MVAHAQVDYGEHDALLFELSVGGAELLDQIRAAHLTPDKVVRVIDHLHLIGFRIPHQKLDNARGRLSFSFRHREKIRIRQFRRRFVLGSHVNYNWRVLTSPCYVISDAHLGVASMDIERRLVKFLRNLEGRAGSLLINGDLFDFWFEWKSVIPRNSFRALAALAHLRESGLPILWIAGNHDCWGDDVLREDIGVEYHVGAWEGTLGGWKARVEHGDGLREKEDRGYRLVRPIMRNAAAIRAFRTLHPDWASWLANGSSGASRVHRARDEGRGLRQIAMAELSARPDLELLIYGHSHVAALEKADPTGVFANAGSWLDAPTFLKITEEKIELRSARDDSAEGDCLHSVDRSAEKTLTDT
jgi:UDP-2,3-diacylglucosamine hydrolase